MKTFIHFYTLILLCLCGDEAFGAMPTCDDSINISTHGLPELESNSKAPL